VSIQTTAVKAAAVSVGTSATLLDRNITGTRSLLVKNSGANPIYIGGSDVTTAQGFPLAVGESISIDVPSWGSGVYGIVAAATETANVLQVGRQSP
jgi:selenophosphate synthase